MPTRTGLVWQAGIVATGVKPHLKTSGTPAYQQLGQVAGMQICVTLVLHSWCHIGDFCD